VRHGCARPFSLPVHTHSELRCEGKVRRAYAYGRSLCRVDAALSTLRCRCSASRACLHRFRFDAPQRHMWQRSTPTAAGGHRSSWVHTATATHANSQTMMVQCRDRRESHRHSRSSPRRMHVILDPDCPWLGSTDCLRGAYGPNVLVPARHGHVATISDSERHCHRQPKHALQISFSSA